MQAYDGKTHEKEPPRSARSLGWRLSVSLVFIGLFAFSAFKIFTYFIQSSDAKNTEKQVRQEIDTVATINPVFVQATPYIPPAEESADANAVAAETGLSAMLASALIRNADTVGALVAGSDIKTYVVQRNNEYYLTHSLLQTESASGAVFLDEICSVSKPSQNLIVYGHNMRNGTAFGKLKEFKQKSYINVYPVIRLCTLKDDGYYAVFSVFECSVNENDQTYFCLRNVSFTGQTEFLDYAEGAKARSCFAIPVDVRENDQLLTLVTCVNQASPDERLIVMARKVREGEDRDGFYDQFPNDTRDLYYQQDMSYIVGIDVYAVQEALTALGYLQTECDGIYGESTADAVSVFQTEHNLFVDGAVGEETRKLLFALAQKQSANP